MKKYYLYRHIRLDKNEPFYIGIGTKPKTYIYPSVEFSRAFNKSSRNNIWNKITSKTEYKIEIIFECSDYDLIKQKEIEFILLYGRIQNNTGVLANLTDGGEGTKGCPSSPETRAKIGLNNFYKGKFGKNNPKSKKIYQYDLNGNFIREWESLADIGRYFNLPNKRIPTFNSKTFKGYRWFYDFLGDKIEKIDYNAGISNRLNKICIPIYQYDLDNNLICTYTSYTEAAMKIGVSTSSIYSVVNRKNNIYKNYIWTKNII